MAGKAKDKSFNFRITFKRSEKYLLDEIVRHSCGSAFVKDLLKLHIPPPPGSDNKN